MFPIGVRMQWTVPQYNVMQDVIGKIEQKVTFCLLLEISLMKLELSIDLDFQERTISLLHLQY